MIQTYFYGGIQLLRLHLGGERGSSKYERMQTGEMAKDGVGGVISIRKFTCIFLIEPLSISP